MADELQPLIPDAPSPATPSPAIVPFAAVWLGVVMLVLAIVFPFLPGSQDPRAELENLRPYSFADRFLPLPIYGIAVVLFMGIITLWQMRHHPRPLIAALQAQRHQAWTAIVLALLAAAVIYTTVALRGPTASL
jgi:hypothetical protein